ncbi:MAG: phosphonate ABC transporter, permease protein PhnE [Acholeplasmatales bacterium]|jgi:phosphonate transport system permease protein|nr:phosphonate ABC transporter, permease protein PhnE [Acholeplasmatales bacterium]
MSDVKQILKNKPKKWLYNLYVLIAILIVLIFSFVSSGIKIRSIDFLPRIKALVTDFIHPNWNLLFGLKNYKGEYGLPYLTMQTVAIAFVGTLIGSLLAIPFGFLASNKITKKYSFWGELFLIIIRTFPELILALILIRFSGPGSFTGTLAIGLHSIGMIGKLYAESIDNMPNETLEALDSVGANSLMKIRQGIMPHVLPEFLSISLYRFDINIRTATILGVVSAGGLGYPIFTATTYLHWSDLSAIVIAVVFVIIIVDLLSNWLRSKLV